MFREEALPWRPKNREVLQLTKHRPQQSSYVNRFGFFGRGSNGSAKPQENSRKPLELPRKTLEIGGFWTTRQSPEDMMNKEFMIQQGGISKATKMLNLSEEQPGRGCGERWVGLPFMKQKMAERLVTCVV